MKATSIGTACCGLILLALMPTTTPADNPAPHLLDRSEVVFDPVAEQEAERLLIRAVVLWRRDNEQPGAVSQLMYKHRTDRLAGNAHVGEGPRLGGLRFLGSSR